MAGYTDPSDPGISHADLAREGMHYQSNGFPSLDGVGTTVGGSASVSIGLSGPTLSTGTTSGSYARAYDFWNGVDDRTWGRNRTHAYAVDFDDTSGNLMVGSGNFTQSSETGAHLAFKMTAGDLLYSVADGTTQNTGTLIAGATAGTKKLRIEFYPGTKAEFHVDGSLMGTATSNLPAAGDGGHPYHLQTLVENSTATDRSMTVYSAASVQHP